MPTPRAFLRVVAALATTATLAAQTPPPATRPQPSTDIVVLVRTALGHGALDDAKRLAESNPAASAASKALAGAMIDMYEGRDEDARTRLTPIVAANPRGEAGLELGLLHMRHGRRDEGRRLIEAISDDLYNRAQGGTVMNDDDYYRLARSAQALGKILLANDAYQRVKGARPDVQTAWGDMFLDRHKADLAAQSYRVAIAADPKWVRAHLGLARAFGSDDPEAAGAAFDAAKAIAPEHPDLWLTLAERKLELEDRPGTAEALDHLAKIRPGTIGETSLRAALAFAARDPEAVRAALARVDAIDPRSALGFRAAGRQAAHDYRFEDAAGFGKQAVERDPDDGGAHGDYGLYLLRTGDEALARIELEVSFKIDNSDPLVKNLLDMLDVLDTFEVVPDGPFIYKFPKADAAALTPYALPLGAEAYKTFSERYGITPKGPILVEVFSEHDDFAVRTVGLMGIRGALGACFGKVVTMDSPRARDPGEYSWHATEWHELAHVFSIQLSDSRVPRWLTEGISVYEEYRRNPAWGRELTLEYAAALGAGKTFGVKGLADAFKNPENYALAYFEASLVVEHLVSLSGDAGLRTLLKAYAGNANDPQAFTQAFGRNLDEVEATYKTFINQRYGALRDAMKPPPSKVDPEDIAGLRARAATAPGNFISQLSLGQALLGAGDLAGAKTALQRASDLAPQAQGSASPHALLAQIAEKEGDEARARRELRALLTYDHANVNAAKHLAQLAGAAKATADQDFALALVTDLDPFDAAAHVLFGRRLLETSNYARALVEFQVALVLGPANLAEAHADVAEALLKLDRKDEARKEAIAALKEAPSFARAQDLLLAAIGRDAR